MTNEITELERLQAFEIERIQKELHELVDRYISDLRDVEDPEVTITTTQTERRKDFATFLEAIDITTDNTDEQNKE